MRLDWEIAKRGWGRYAAYPAAAWAGAFTNSVFGFMQAYVLIALFRHRTDVGGYDVGDAVTYVWLAQALLMTVYVFGWDELALRIRDGSIATDLSRPLNPQRYWLAFDLGRAPFHFIFRGHPAVPDRSVRLRPPLPHAATCGRLRAQRVPCGCREPRLSLPLQRRRLLDRRPSRRLASLGHRVPLLLGHDAAARVLPDTGSRPSRACCRSPRSCRCRSTSTSASTRARPRVRCLRCRRPGRWRCSPSDASRSTRGTRKLVVQGG